MIKLYIIGNMTQDPNTRQVSGGQHTVVDFTVAVNDRRQKDHTTFVKVSAWDKLGDIAARFARKGDKIGVICKDVSARAYTGKDGQVHASLEATAEEIELLGSRRSDADDHGLTYTPPAKAPQQQSMMPSNMSMEAAMQAARDATQGFMVADNEDVPW